METPPASIGTPDATQPSASSHTGLIPARLQDFHFDRAQTSLKQAISRYAQQLRIRRPGTPVELQAALKTDLDRLTASLEKLDQRLIRVAVFGLVSRGKSAVVNALLGQKVLQTGPINGVTQYPRSVYWSIPNGMPVELIDTPGLDEVGGESRASMARQVADQADLILFVVAGDITRTEYRALTDLQQANKPIVLVFNKIDLYPRIDRQSIFQKLQTLFAQSGDSDRFKPRLSSQDIVLVSAEPAPLEVRVEYPDGRVEYEWDAPEPQIEPLREKLLEILNREGKSLLALNALRQASETEGSIARKTVKLHEQAAEDLIWQFAKWKAIAVGANPIAFLDLMGGAVTDLLMIRALAKLYGLPMNSYEAGKLLKAILFSAGGLLLGEVGSGVLLGVGKSGAAAATAFDSVNGVITYGTTAVAQATLAGFGSYRVGKAAQVYLEQGCTWGPLGADTVIQEILNQVDRETVIYRLRQELLSDSSRPED